MKDFSPAARSLKAWLSARHEISVQISVTETFHADFDRFQLTPNQLFEFVKDALDSP